MLGYKTENGMTVIDRASAEKIRNLYRHYLSGLSLAGAAKEAGLKTYHGTAKRILTNRRYLGDSFYPAIIDADLFDKTQEELIKRATKLGRLDKVSKEKEIVIPTQFSVKPVREHFDNPFKQAEYLYSLIGSEVN
ncbi:hypothetical protein M2454_001789 [Aequitasia blattaphilus]|uniref:Recombinase family protein n=1 Tax=Aequitasia blattaphilus TaxID=2949332 RepID=A0ABT1EBX4_9FIRM|nr:recombinase family protein [Aequitasia blattaphilus]MCP1102336.1 recombinase family protein [Aequitasia blattaphilus]MCR8614976.1 recombinase family protein [Aequitasia blattaphilus]